jgi:polyisoprenoid-binding protein YceI
LPGADWFAVASAKTAKFVATRVTVQGPGHYVAAGTLTIRGKAVPVTLPFTLAVAGDIATMTGRMQLDRRAWKLGMESDATAEYVAFAVPLAVRVVARRLP